MSKQDEVGIGRNDLVLKFAAQAVWHHWVGQVGVEVDDELTVWSLDAEAEPSLAKPLDHVARRVLSSTRQASVLFTNIKTSLFYHTASCSATYFD